MGNAQLFKTITLFILGLALFSQLNAQPASYIIYNKTSCIAQVTAYCTDLNSASNTLAPNGSWPNSCPAGETLCTVTMVLPGPVTVVVADYSLLCPNPGYNIFPPSPCYTQNVQWQTISGYVV